MFCDSRTGQLTGDIKYFGNVEGEESKVVLTCRRIVVKKCQHGRGECQKYFENANVFYGQSLIAIFRA